MDRIDTRRGSGRPPGRRPKGTRDFRKFRRRRIGASLVLCPLLLLGLYWVVAGLLSALSSMGGDEDSLQKIDIASLAIASGVVQGMQETGLEVAETGEAREEGEREAIQAKEEVRQKEQEKRGAAREKEKESKAPPPPSDPTLYLTVPKLGIYSHTVRNDSSSWALDMGAIKLPTSAHPWQKNGNTYIAGHRIGWPGTQSYYQFYNLPSMVAGDVVYLTDTNGTVYEYRVSEVFAVSPSENWVTAPVAGRDMVTLQTCTESPTDWWTIGDDLMNSTPQSGRLVVRADRVT
jgi:LPXTG-site transpeptidase (sortase) family protein